VRRRKVMILAPCRIHGPLVAHTQNRSVARTRTRDKEAFPEPIRYSPSRWPEAMALIEKGIGRPLPEDFADTLKASTLQRFEVDLREVEGAIAFIRQVTTPKCIASSSSMERLLLSLRVLGIDQDFPDRVFSADSVPRGKPAPDIFLYAAAQIGVAPSDCMVIEDSASGVQAGVAAGMTVIGLCAANHCRAGHAERLSDAGASYVVDSWLEVARLISPA
jgi:HAD superfamily hydrolase (TIGR01509 family)